MAFKSLRLEHTSCAAWHDAHTAAGGNICGQESHQHFVQSPRLSHGMPKRIGDTLLQLQIARAARKDLSATRASQVTRGRRAIGRSEATRSKQATSGGPRDGISGLIHRGPWGRIQGPGGRKLTRKLHLA
jgi:hypothetical protein